MSAPTRILALLLLASCQRYPASPEAALQAIEQVVVSANALEAWKLVDKDTKNAVMSVYSNEKTMRTIIRAKYPPAEAERELTRLGDAEQPDAAHFFATRMDRWGTLKDFRPRLGSVSGPIRTKPDGDAVLVARQDGQPFHLVKAGGGWAWSDARAPWALEKDRAGHALTTTQDNAALYKKSGSP